MKTPLFYLVIIFGFGISVANSQDVQLGINWDQKAWRGYPSNVDKIKSEWINNTLHVKVIVDVNTSYKISEKNPRAEIKNHYLYLYYKYDLVTSKLAPGGFAQPGACRPVILNFLISNIPKYHYKIIVNSYTNEKVKKGQAT